MLCILIWLMLHFFGLGKFNNFINIGNGWGRNSSYMIFMNMPNQVMGFVLAHYGINNVTRVVNFSHLVAPLIYRIAIFFLYGSSHQSIILFFLSQFCLHPQAWDRLFYASQIPIHGTLYFIFSLERIFSSCNN